MFNLGPLELVIILVIVILLFGVGRLPELGSGLGEGIKNFRKSIRDAKHPGISAEEKTDSDNKPEVEKITEKHNVN